MVSACLRTFSAPNCAGFDRKSRGFACDSARIWRARRAHRPQKVCNDCWQSMKNLESKCARKFETCGAFCAKNSRTFGFDLISPTKMRPRFSWGGKSALHTLNFPVNSRPFQCSSIDLLFGFAPFLMLGRCSVVDSLCGFAPITVPEH